MSTYRSTRSGTHPTSSKTASKKSNKKVVPGEAEFLFMIELASYEVNIDPYRGIRTLVAQHQCQLSEQCTDRTVPLGSNDSEIDICKNDASIAQGNSMIIDHSVTVKCPSDLDAGIRKIDDCNMLNDEESGSIEPTIPSRTAEIHSCTSDGACLQVDCENNRFGDSSDCVGWWRRNCSIIVDGKRTSHVSPEIPGNIAAENVETKELSSEECVQLISGTCCPSLVLWTSQAIQDHRKKRARRKRKAVSESIPPSQFCFIGRRSVYNTSKVCPCDFNPFCLGSLGGVMDDILNSWAAKLCFTHSEQMANNNSDITDGVIVLDDGDISPSDDAKLSDSPFYSPETLERLKVVRKYISVDLDVIRSYFKSTFKEFTSKTVIDEYVNRLRQLHESMIFVNPLLSTTQQFKNEINGKQDLLLSIPPGIENLGATCYLNTQLQCLAQNIVFVEGIVSWRPATDDDSGNDKMSSVLSLFQDLFLRMNAGPLSVVNTLEFSNALGLDHYEQQDPNEFSRLLFDRIHDSFKGSSSNKNLGNLLPRLFQGVMVYETTCLQCDTKSRRTEEFMDLNLPIVRPESKESEPKKGISSMFPNVDTEVQYCLNQYCTAETLNGENQYFCDFCGCKRDAKREVAFQTLPPVLNVQLCRYVFNREKLIKTKLSEKVLLPLHLNLRSLENEDPTMITERHYTLCAVMRHKGTSAYSGHYVAEAMDWLSGQWYEFNDQNVAHLPDGPSCCFHPSLIDFEDCTTLKNKNGTEQPFSMSVSGSQDAYNMYYVEDAFLATCIRDSFKSKEKFEEDLHSEAGDILNIIASERSTYYDSLRQLCTDDGIATDRLNKRREAICCTMFPSLSVFQLTNPDDLVWVDALFLQHFISCTDHRLFFEESSNFPVLQHRKYLCSHKFPGLHPRIARRGKLLTRKSYDAYIAALNEEKLAVSGITSQCSDFPVNDCVIVPTDNLVCDECLQEYRSELSSKLQLAEALLSIFHDLDQKESKFSVYRNPDESSGCDQNVYAYIVSRKFVTWFRNKVARFMKHNASLVAAEFASGGLDLVDFSDFKCYSSELPSGSPDDESIAIRVNGAITCRHGNMSTNSFNNFIYVPWSTWSLIKGVFTKAIEHKRKRIDVFDECNSNAESPISCEQCLEEGMAKTQARSNLADLVKFCRDSDSLKVLSKDDVIEMSMSLSCNRLYLVHKKEISAWNKFLFNVSRKDGEKRHVPLPSGNATWICVTNIDESSLSPVDRSRLDFLSTMFCPITCSEHGQAMRLVLFRDVEIHVPHHPFQLDDSICLLEESSYLAYISHVGAAAVMLYPLDYDPNFHGATIHDFIMDGADFFDRTFGHSSFHPSCIPARRINGKVDSDRFIVANEHVAVLFQLEEASCVIDSCQQHQTVSDIDYESCNRSQQTQKGVANNPIDIDQEIVQVLVSPPFVDVKVLDVEADGNLDYVMSVLISSSGTQMSNDYEDSQPHLRRSSRKRTSRYPVGCILDEETVKIRLDSNIAAIRLLLLERCTKGTHFSLDHSLTLIVENPNASKNKVVAISSDENGKSNDSESSFDSPPIVKAVDLSFDTNSQTLREICEVGIGIPFNNSMSLSIVRQANVEKTATSIPTDDLMGHLLNLASLTVEGDQSNPSKRSKRIRTEKGFSGTFLSSSDSIKAVNSLDGEGEVVVVVGHVESPIKTNDDETVATVSVKLPVDNISSNVPESKSTRVLVDVNDIPSTNSIKNGNSHTGNDSYTTDRIVDSCLNRKDIPLSTHSEDPYRDCFEEDDSDDDIELLGHKPFSKQNRSSKGGPVVPCKPTLLNDHAFFKQSNGTASITASDLERKRVVVSEIVQLLLSNPDARKNEEMCRMAAENVVRMSPNVKNANDLVDEAFAMFLDLTLP